MELNVPLEVAATVPPSHAQMTLRHYTFLLEGLRGVAEECDQLGIGFRLLLGDPVTLLSPAALTDQQVGLVVADFRYHHQQFIMAAHTK